MSVMVTSARSRAVRGLRAGTAAALAVLVLAVAPVSFASPTRDQIADAKARLEEMDQRLGVLVEEYDKTQVALQAAQDHLAELREVMQRARAAEQRANQRLEDAAREAYKNQGSDLGLILSSESFSVLSDRVYFLDAAAQDQEDLATRADVAEEEASRISEQLQRVVAEQRNLLDKLGRQQDQIEQGIADQKALIGDLEEKLRQQILEQRRQEAAQAAALAAPAAPSGGGGAPTANPPPISGSGAAAAIAAAESVLGVPYQYGGASPETGFDCSGLTMWAWAHAGVSLPHSSQMQYSSLPHVSKDQLQPGDLVFFYSPIHHVGLYVGGGMMIHAPHTGSVVSRVAVYWQYFVGAARPG